MKKTCLLLDKNGNEKNSDYLFIAKVTTEKDEVVKFRIAAADLYKVFINGESVFFGPSRSPKGYCIENVFSCALDKGENLITIRLTSYGVANYYVMKKDPFLSVSFEVDGKKYDENDFFAYEFKERVRKVQRFSFQRGFVEIYEQKKDFADLCREYYESGERLSPERGTTPFILNEMVPISLLTKRVNGSVISQGNVVVDESKDVWEDRSIAQVGNNYEGYGYADLSECLTDTVCKFTYQKASPFDAFSKNRYKIYDYGRNVSGFIRLSVTVKSETKLYAVFDEILSDGSVSPVRNFCCNVIKWKLAPGKYVLESFETNTLRYLQIVCSEGEFTVDNVEMKLLENASAYNAVVKTDDKVVNEIFAAAANTLAQNSFDFVFDCPSRERAGWINDLYYSMSSASLLAGDFNAVDATILNFVLYDGTQTVPKNMIPMCYPADHIDGQFLPNCALWYIYDLIRRIDSPILIGYKDRIVAQIEGIFRYFERFENEYSLLEDVEGWVFIEWSKANDPEFTRGVNYPSNMLYYKALKAVGDRFGNKKYLEKAEKIKNAIIAQSFNGEFFEDNRIRVDGKLVRTGNISEACQYFAFFSKVATVEANEGLYKNLLNNFGVFRNTAEIYPNIDKANIITGLLMRLDLLNERGEYDTVIKETKEIFGVMAEKTKTLWEHTGEYASCNHCIASYSAAILLKSLLGIDGITGDGVALSDGFSKSINCVASFTIGGKKTEIGKENGKRTVRTSFPRQ